MILQEAKTVNEECLGTNTSIKDEIGSSDDVKNISLMNSDTAHIRSSQLLLQEIPFEIRSGDILHFIKTHTTAQKHINDQLLNINARIVQPDIKDTNIRLQYHGFQLHPITDWEINAIQSFGRILQDFSIETIHVKREIWQAVFHEVIQCKKRFGKKFRFTFEKEDFVVCGLKDTVNIIVSAINETVASHTTNQLDTPQIIDHETAEKEVPLNNISEYEDINPHTEAQYESSSKWYRYSELCQNMDDFTYRYSQWNQVGTGKKHNLSKDSQKEKCLQKDRMPYKENNDYGRNVTSDNRKDSANISITANPKSKETTKVVSLSKEKMTSKKKLGCRSPLALLAQYILMLVSTMPITALPQPSGFNSEVFCHPKFFDTGQNDDLFRKLECYIPTCTSVSKILYEKSGVYFPEQWTPVFEWINKTNYHSLDVGNGYTLSKRYDYYAFQTHHILYIDPNTVDDNGKWRCVVVDTNNIKYESNAVNVKINVTPSEEKIMIKPMNPHIVTGERHGFTCSVDAEYPKPDIVWYVNGIEYGTGTSVRHTQEDGLWYIKNTITVGFDSVGSNELSCVLQTKPMRRRHISIDVKESVTVLNPVTDMNIAIQKTSMFILLCSGVGYKPKIRWEKGGNTIEETDEKYNIQNICDSEGCTGSITPIIDDSQSACLQLQEYVGVYTCVISLELPYNSSQVSSKMNVYTPENLCRDQSTGLVIGLTVLSSVCVAITMIIVAIVVLLLNHRHGSNKKTFRVQLRQYKQVNSGQLPDLDKL